MTVSRSHNSLPSKIHINHRNFLSLYYIFELKYKYFEFPKIYLEKSKYIQVKRFKHLNSIFSCTLINSIITYYAIESILIRSIYETFI